MSMNSYELVSYLRKVRCSSPGALCSVPVYYTVK